MDLVFFGIQGSGKGTQAKRLCAEFGYAYFEAGGELRRIAGSGSELGSVVKSYIDVGKLVPHEIIMRVCEEAIRAKDPNKHILFDGIPRDGDQQRDFDAIMRNLGRDFRCIEITLDPEEAVKRILGRAELEGRKDDANEATIRKRMALFNEKTRPVIQKYKKEGKLVEIDGSGSVEEIFERLKAALEGQS
jgi:adenylate kinase